MKKYLVIAATSSLILFGCSKINTTPESQAVPQANADAVATPTSDLVPKPMAKGIPADGAVVIPTASVATAPDLVVSDCYTITNLETEQGFAAYKVSYTDCNGVEITVPLGVGESISSCLKYARIKANFAYSLAPAKPGNCITR